MRYFLTACFGLAVDLSIFWTFTHVMSPACAHICSYSIGMVSTFFIQKRFVFDTNRKTHHAFGIALVLWAIGLGLSALLIDFLVMLPLLSANPLAAKLITINFTFWYNFLSRKIAFGD